MFLHSTVMGELENARLSCAHAHAKITGPSANVHPMCTHVRSLISPELTGVLRETELQTWTLYRTGRSAGQHCRHSLISQQ